MKRKFVPVAIQLAHTLIELADLETLQDIADYAGEPQPVISQADQAEHDFLVKQTREFIEVMQGEDAAEANRVAFKLLEELLEH